MTQPVVGVRFKRAGKIYYFGVGDRSTVMSVGDRVVADTQRGLEMGRIVLSPEQIVDNKGLGRLKNITRLASDDDLAGEQEAKDMERRAVGAARAEIERLRLPMHAVVAEGAFDGSRVTVFFLSDEAQVDSRELVRILSEQLKVRVNLRQIGPRDRAKLLGGIDRCGRELCCSTWITEFQPIQIRMAKNQQLPLNPSEISGVCGKLLCCLSFEDDQYSEMNKGLPKIGASLISAVGRGRVVDVNVLTRLITISWETGARITVAGDEFAEQQDRRAKAIAQGVPAAEALLEFEADRAPKRPAAPVIEELPPRLDGAQREERPSPERGRGAVLERSEPSGRRRRGNERPAGPRPAPEGVRPAAAQPQSGAAPAAPAPTDAPQARNARRRRDRRRGGRSEGAPPTARGGD
ncbi:MAG: stage 0 sporulation family protein [Anaerolineae bacterium]